MIDSNNIVNKIRMSYFEKNIIENSRNSFNYYFSQEKCNEKKVKENESSYVVCLSAFDQYIINNRDFITAMQSKKHHPISGGFTLGKLDKNEYLTVIIEDIITFQDKNWCITHSAGCQPLCISSIDKKERNLIHVTDGLFEPMIGIIGTEPEKDKLGSGRGNKHGGNLDLPCLKKGSTIIMPKFVDSPHLWFGDIHAKQGWGELAGVALECSGVIKFKLKKTKLKNVINDPIIIRNNSLNGYDAYYVSCRETYEEAIHCAVENALLMKENKITSFFDLGINGDLYIGQGIGKTISVAVKKHVNQLSEIGVIQNEQNFD